MAQNPFPPLTDPFAPKTTFTPTVKAPPNQAPYKPGLAPAQLKAKGNTTGVPSVSDEQAAQQHARVLAEQRKLISKGWDIQADGVLGPKTQTALAMDSAGLPPPKQAALSHVNTKLLAQGQGPLKAPAATVPTEHFEQYTKPTNFKQAVAYRQASMNAAAAALTKQYGEEYTKAPGWAQSQMQKRWVAQQTGPKGDEAAQFSPQDVAAAGAAGVQQTIPMQVLSGAAAGIVHPATDIVGAVGRHIGITPPNGAGANTNFQGAVSDVAQIASYFVGGEAVDPVKVVAKIIGDSTGKAADASLIEEAATTAAQRPILTATSQQMEQELLKTPGLSKEQVGQVMHLYDTAAYAEAARAGVDPETMFDRIWEGTKYSADHPELQGELPDAVHAQMDQVHSIPEDKQGRNLRARAKLIPAESQPQHEVFSKNGIRVLGKATPEEWLARIQHATPDMGQQTIDAAFYDRLEPVFQRVFGEGYQPVMKAFAASQANAGTKEGLASVLRAAERIERGAPIQSEEGSIGSVVADAIENAYKGETLTKGQAAKLSDFIDSIRGLSTREWMGHDPLGGMPVAGDVHAARDAGYLDPKLVGQSDRGRAASAHNFILKNHGVNLRELAPDIPGAPSGKRYEYIQQFYTEMSDHLNTVKYHGRSDWTPAQAQAMGWATMQRFYGKPVRDINEWVDAGIRQAKGGLVRDQGREAERHIAGANKGVHVLDRRAENLFEREAHPDYLYHGTDDHGLQGIMSEGKIRATATERNPADIRAWLTESPGRAASQGRHVIAIPRKNIPDELLSKHPLGMYSSPNDVPIFGAADDSRVAQLHSESVPYPDLHPAENRAYNAMTDTQKVEYSHAVDRAVTDGHFERVLGVESKGEHFGVGVWRGEENPGLGAHVSVPQDITPEVKAKLDALAASQGMAKEQGSVSWGRPLAHDAKDGPNVYPAVISRQPASGKLGAAVDKAVGDGLVGVIHGPENVTYLVDFSGTGVDLHKLDPAATPIKWEGSYVYDERLHEMASDVPTFQQAIEAAPNSDKLKNAIEHVNSVIKNIQKSYFGATGREAAAQYEDLLSGINEKLGSPVGPRGMTADQRLHAENAAYDLAQKHADEPWAKQFMDLADAAQTASNATDPEFLFEDSPGLFGSMERAQGHTQLLRQDAKGAVQRFSDLRHRLLLTPKTDVTTTVHELVHAMIPYLGHPGTDEETLARSFEAYVMEGHAPTAALRPTFDTLAKGMREVYGDKNVPGAELTPELSQHFDAFLSKHGEATAADVRAGLDTPTQWGAGLHFQGDEPPEFDWSGSPHDKPRIDLMSEFPGQSHWDESAVRRGDELGVDPADVQGTGDGGRVTIDDVENYAFTQMKPEDQLRSLTRGLKIARGKQETGYSAERGKRFAEVGSIASSDMSSDEKLIAAKGALKGELPKVTIGGKARLMTQDTLDSLGQQVWHHATLSNGQKVRVVDALHTLVTEGKVPTNSELALMRHVWGKDTIGSLTEIATNWERYKNTVLSAMNIPRSIMSSMDVSFGLRQALVAAFYDPQTWFKAWKAQFAYLSKWTGGGEEAYQALMTSVHAKPNFPIYQEMGLAITDMEHEIGLREEQYQSNLAEKLTIKGHGPGNLVRGSGRAYTGMAVMLRTELADKLLAQAAAQGRDVHDADFLKELGHFINGITGRGDLPGKVLQESAPLLNTLFFSPRLLASRVQMLNPANYLAGDKFVRQQYLRAGLSTFGSLATILGAIKLFAPDAQVGTDWRSSDFGKIKIGDTRIDLGGGFNQLFHLAGMIYTGQKMSTSTGRVSSLTSNQFGQATRMDAFVNFLSGKLAPTPSMLNDWAKNKDPQHLGQPFNWKDEAASHFQPLIAQDAWNLYNDPVHGLNGIEAAAAGYGLEATGVGLQTYGPTVPGKAKIGQYEQWAQATGVKIPPAIKEQMLRNAYLKSITSAHPKDSQGAMKEMIAYYAEQTGKTDLNKYLTVSDEAMQKRVMGAIRARMAGSASRYESVITARAKAKGLTK